MLQSVTLLVFLSVMIQADKRIIGGQLPSGDVSWVVYLIKDMEFLRPLGTGVIISPLHVLTSIRNVYENLTNNLLHNTTVSCLL